MRPMKRYTNENSKPEMHIGEPTLIMRRMALSTGCTRRISTPSALSARIDSTHPTTVLSVVPQAAPATPSAGKGPRPQIRIGSSTVLISTVEAVMTSAGVNRPNPRSPAVITPLRASGSAPTTDAKRYDSPAAYSGDIGSKPSTSKYKLAIGADNASRTATNILTQKPCATTRATRSRLPAPSSNAEMACTPNSPSSHITRMIHVAYEQPPRAMVSTEPSIPTQY
mmetsp:Transcript_21863/g.67584  ORF Transcript_21863/g.67584 Transcript_21863/m.67584 type:complete len:225 (+) Transcript_21863:148-822(+)